jgi:hypothetical protein
MVLEQGADPREGPKLHRRMVARPDVFTWLTPPHDRGHHTVLDVLDGEAYVAAVTAWAEVHGKNTTTPCVRGSAKSDLRRTVTAP